MPYATTPDGIRLYYETHGTGDPLLLVMGQSGNHHGWDYVRADFVARHHVIVYDHRGTGQSDKPESPPYTTRGFAADAIAILDHLGIERAHAYGISMGGRICQWLGIDYPERMGALVLGCTTPGNKHGIPRPPDVDAAMRNRSGGMLATFKMMTTALSPKWIFTHPGYMRVAQAMMKYPTPPHALKLHYEASEGHDAWDLLPTIHSPTLVIHGSEDQVNVTANAPLLAGRIPGAELYIVKGGRHLFLVEFREEASRVVLGFLRKHPVR
ncbi:MAG: alpha/beta fold hydrolase [Caldilineaceae bacterium]